MDMVVEHWRVLYWRLRSYLRVGDCVYITGSVMFRRLPGDIAAFNVGKSYAFCSS